MKDNKYWNPWEIGRKDFEQNTMRLREEIIEPPCKNCIHFQPRIVTNRKGEHSGVCICNADEQYFDFSCFEVDENK